MTQLPQRFRRRPVPAVLRPGERGLLHGLSILAITLALFGAIAFFAFARFPLACTCADGSTQKTRRNGFDSPEKLCQKTCKDRGGGLPAKRGKRSPEG
ncbi:MAG: hypothetical protein HY901_05195 [Deltaproteobacteria bacterium]|nr:hypothetical protein [Deltaproteobacteria bacterium]